MKLADIAAAFAKWGYTYAHSQAPEGTSKNWYIFADKPGDRSVIGAGPSLTDAVLAACDTLLLRELFPGVRDGVIWDLRAALEENSRLGRPIMTKAVDEEAAWFAAQGWVLTGVYTIYGGDWHAYAKIVPFRRPDGWHEIGRTLDAKAPTAEEALKMLRGQVVAMNNLFEALCANLKARTNG